MSKEVVGWYPVIKIQMKSLTHPVNQAADALVVAALKRADIHPFLAEGDEVEITLEAIVDDTCDMCENKKDGLCSLGGNCDAHS